MGESTRRLAAAGLALGAIAAVAAVAGGAGAAPSTFSLTLEGSHVLDTNLPAGIRHEGPFTASAPFCATGTAADVEDVKVEPLSVLRRFTCDDGSGTMTALLPTIRAEHGGTGTWRIVDGTGQYATLRGIGTYAGTLVDGSPVDLLSIKFRTEWTGTVDFDVDPPSIGLAARAVKLRRRPAGAFTVRVTLSVANEAPGARLSYSVGVLAGVASLAQRDGATRTARTAIALRIKPRRTTRRVKVKIDVTDPVGNRSGATRTVTLPR